MTDLSSVVPSYKETPVPEALTLRTGDQHQKVERSWWDKYLLHPISVPHDLLTAAIGRTISDDPEFDKVMAGKFMEQRSGADIVRLTGLGKKPGDMYGNIAAMGLGLVYDVMLDPLFLFKFAASPTKALATIRLAARAKKPVKGGMRIIDPKPELNKQIAHWVSKKKSKKWIDRKVDQYKAENQRLNRYLIKLQKNGVVLDDLGTAQKTHAAQVMAGQAPAVGFSLIDHPLGRTVARMMGRPLTVIERTAIPLPGLNQVMKMPIAGVVKAGEALKLGTRLAAMVNKAFPSLNLASTEGRKEALKMFWHAGRKIGGSEREVVDNFIRYLKHEFPSESVDDIIKSLDEITGSLEQTEDMLAVKQFMQDYVYKHSERIERILGEGVNLPRIGKKQLDLTTDQARYSKHTPVTEHEAMGAVLKGKDIPAIDGKKQVADYIVQDVTGKPGFRVDSLSRQFEGIGVSKLTKVKDGNKSYLVGRNLVGNQTKVWKPLHRQNLEVLAASLAKQGKALRRTLSPKDFILGVDGRVQLVAPNKIKDFGKKGSRVEKARSLSVQSIQRMLTNVESLPSGEPLNILRNTSSVRATSARSVRFEGTDLDPNFLKSDPMLHELSVDAAFGRMTNLDASPLNQLSPEMQAEVQKAIKGGQIEQKLDDAVGYLMKEDGSYEVVQNSHILYAAREIGGDQVYAIKEGWAGPVSRKTIKDPEAFSHAAHEAVAFSKSDPPDIAISTLQETSAKTALAGETAPGIRHFSTAGKQRLANDEMVRVAAKSDDVRKRLVNWFTRKGSSGTSGWAAAKVKKTRATAMEQALGEGPQATARAIKAMKQSTDPDGFVEALGINMKVTSGPDYDAAANQLLRIQRYLGEIENDLMARGIVLGEDMMAASAVSGNVVVRTTPQQFDLFSAHHDADELTEMAKQLIEQHAPDVGLGQRVGIYTARDPDRAPTVAGLVGRHKPTVAAYADADEVVSYADPDRLARAKEAGIHRLVDDDPLIAETGQFKLGEGLVRSRQGVAQIMSGWVETSTGQIFASTRHRNPFDAMRTFYKEGVPYVEEVYVASKHGITLGQLAGARVSQLTNGDLAIAGSRVRELSRSFIKKGFDPDARFKVKLPYPDEDLNKRLINPDMTLTEATKFKFKVGDNDRWLKVQPFDDQVTVGFKDPWEKFPPDSPERAVAKWAHEKFEDSFARNFEKGLLKRQLEGYMPRIISNHPKTAQAMDTYFREFMGKHKKASLWEKTRHYRKRSLTDMTLDEINNFKEFLDKNKLGPEFLDYLRKGGKSSFLFKMNMIAPDLTELFKRDILSVVLERELADVRRIGMQDLGDELGKRFSLMRGEEHFNPKGNTWGEIHDYLARGNKVGKIDNQIVGLKEELAKLDDIERSFDAAGGVDDIQIDRLNQQRQALEEKLNDLNMESVDAKLRKAEYPDFEGFDPATSDVYLTRGEAKRLLEDGKLQWEDIKDAVGPYARVPLSVVKAEGTRFHVFPRDIANFIEKQFAAYTNRDGLGNELFNWVQKATNIFRKTTLLATIPYPIFFKYGNRNFLSNAMQAAAAGVDMSSVGQGMELWTKIMRARGKPQAEARALLDTVLIKGDLGQVVTGGELWDEFMHRSLAGSRVYNDLAVGMTGDAVAAVRKKGLTEASRTMGGVRFAADRAVFGLGTKYAENVENMWRMIVFTDGYKKTAAWDAADELVGKTMYYYNEMNMMDKKLLRTVYPFWSWIRKNIPRQFEILWTNPLYHVRAARAVRDLEEGAGGPVDERDFEVWLRDRFPIPMAKKDGKWISGVGQGPLPFSEIWETLRDPMAGAKSIFIDGMTPIAKFPIEQFGNISLFSSISSYGHGRKMIERYPGEPARGWTLSKVPIAGTRRVEHFINTFLRPGKEALRALDELMGMSDYRNNNPLGWMRLYDLGYGALGQSTPGKSRMYEDFNRDKEIRYFEGIYRREEKKDNPNPEVLEDAKKFITRLRLTGSPF